MSLELHAIEFSVGREAQVMGTKQRKLNRTRKVSKTRGFSRLAAGILLLVSAVVVGEDSVDAFADGKSCCGGVRTGARI